MTTERRQQERRKRISNIYYRAGGCGAYKAKDERIPGFDRRVCRCVSSWDVTAEYGHDVKCPHNSEYAAPHSSGAARPVAANANSTGMAKRAAGRIFDLFKNASYFSTRNAEHKSQMLDGWAAIIDEEFAAAPAPSATEEAQRRMTEWGIRCFGAEQMSDPKVRALRLAEEAIEFAQAVDAPKDALLTLVGYVYGKEPGKPFQELGGVAVTALAAASAIGVQFNDALMVEVERVESKTPEHFAKRNQVKVALLASSAPTPLEVTPAEAENWLARPENWQTVKLKIAQLHEGGRLPSSSAVNNLLAPWFAAFTNSVLAQRTSSAAAGTKEK